MLTSCGQLCPSYPEGDAGTLWLVISSSTFDFCSVERRALGTPRRVWLQPRWSNPKMTGACANLYSFPHSQSAYRSHCKTRADTKRLLHPVLKCSCLSRSLCTAASQHRAARPLLALLLLRLSCGECVCCRKFLGSESLGCYHVLVKCLWDTSCANRVLA